MWLAACLLVACLALTLAQDDRDPGSVILTSPDQVRKTNYSGTVGPNTNLEQSKTEFEGNQREQWKREIRGKTYRAAAIIEPPFVNYVNTTEEAWEEMGYGPGIVIDLLMEFGKKYNVTFDIELHEGAWGDYDKTTNKWTGAFGKLQDGKVDMLAAAAMMRLDRKRICDFTYPFTDSTTGVLLKSPDKYTENMWMIVSKPFERDVWVLIAVSVVVSGFVLKALCIALKTETEEVQYSLLGSVWVFFSIFAQQGLPVQPRTWTCRTMLAFWWLGALTLVATFTGNMVALFAVKKVTLPFHTPESFVNLLEHHGWTVVMSNESTTRYKHINGSQTGLYARLRHEMLENGRYVPVSNLEEGLKQVETHNHYALLASHDTLKVIAHTNCNVTVATPGLMPVYYSLPIKLNETALLNLLSDDIRHYFEKGFIVKWRKNYDYELGINGVMSNGTPTIFDHQQFNQCTFTEHVEARGTAITIDEAQGAFWILVGCLYRISKAITCNPCNPQ